jgi:hypothetical protein
MVAVADPAKSWAKMIPCDNIRAVASYVEALEAENKAMREALERLGSMEAFYIPSYSTSPESIMRLTFARLVLEGVSIVDAEIQAYSEWLADEVKRRAALQGKAKP